MWSARARPEAGTRPGWSSSPTSLLAGLDPELQLEGTPYRALWREREARRIRLAGRVGPIALALGWLLRDRLVDLPLRAEADLRWIAFRPVGATVLAALLLLSFAPPFKRAPWVRLPLLGMTVALSALAARAVVWIPTVPYLYAFALAVGGVLLLRQSLPGALGTFALCLGAQWLVAWRLDPVPLARLAGASFLSVAVIALSRWRMVADVRAFLAERRELDAQRRLVELAHSKRKVLIETMEAFALAVEAKDPYTHGHSRRVSILAEKVCRALGLDTATCETARIAGILHDIGKIGMPERVLKKPGRLTPSEAETFKRHSQLGSRIVSAVTELEEVGRTILHHHERFDGAGYPERLVGDRIPILSRILSVCDSYDAMTSDRPYRASVAHRMAIEEIARGRGSQFDPQVASAFLSLFTATAPEYPEHRSGLKEPPMSNAR